MRCEDEQHFVGEVGTNIYINCGIDVSGAINVSVIISRPDNTVFQRSAVPEAYQGSANYVRFVIEAGDFNQAGDFTGQVELTLGSWTGKGKEFTIAVEDGLSSSSSSSGSVSSSSSSSI
jgi:hypothetical protein